MNPLRLTAYTALTMAAFAANSLFCRLALKNTSIDAATFTTVRILSAAAMLWLVMRWRTQPSLRHGSWRSALALFIYAATLSFAYRTIAAGAGALMLFGAVQVYRRRTHGPITKCRLRCGSVRTGYPGTARRGNTIGIGFAADVGEWHCLGDIFPVRAGRGGSRRGHLRQFSARCAADHSSYADSIARNEARWTWRVVRCSIWRTYFGTGLCDVVHGAATHARNDGFDSAAQCPGYRSIRRSRATERDGDSKFGDCHPVDTGRHRNGVAQRQDMKP